MNNKVLVCSLLSVLSGGVLLTLVSCGSGNMPARGRMAVEPPAKVEIRRVDGAFKLFVNGQPFYVRGAGIEFGSPEKLARHGGNAFRTWTTENGRESGQQVLDRARTNGLYVAMGLEVGSERHGFDYSDPTAVAKQLERVKAEVLKYKDHPALLAWIIGNELNLNATNTQVWSAVNQISQLIHQVDPNHPTMTALSGFGRGITREITTLAPDLDLIGVQMYADIVNLPRYLKESDWNRPYMVTEWGATGHWEGGNTAWGAPIENDSTAKADNYLQRFNRAIRPDQSNCLGSFVFLWGQKQERTPTWYGMFLETGEETAAVDVMHFIWKSEWPANRSPRIDGAWLDGKTAYQNIRVPPGRPCLVKVAATDENHDTLAYAWEILEESSDLKQGGDAESRPQSLPGLILSATAETTLTTPAKAGAYRLFAYVRDGQGGAAHVNIPFLVEAPSQVAAQTSAP